jgi:ketosteroid isomerase-like protein
MQKKKLKIVAIVLAGLFVFGCQSAQQPEGKNSANTNTSGTNKAIDPKAVEEAKALLVAHDKALNDQSLDGVMATFSTDPKVVLLGSGAGERFLGTEAIKSAYTEILKDYDKGTFEPGCAWKEGGMDEAGKMAWFAATCDAKDSKNGAKREYVLNVSATAVKQADGWKFIMLHMSNATNAGPPPDAKKAEAKSSPEDKK